MGKFVSVGKTGDFAEGAMKAVTVQGKEILIAKAGNSYYAIDNRCPHMGARLSEGKLEGTVVTCPRHGSRFDLTDGRVVRWLQGTGLIARVGSLIKSPRPVTSHRTRTENDQLLIEI
jgi:3-phenylpropionate/trans-cinnamate dioxygenase ferredoxin subunit